MSTTSEAKLIPKANSEWWKDKYRFLVLATVSIVDAAVYATPYVAVPLEKEHRLVAKLDLKPFNRNLV